MEKHGTKKPLKIKFILKAVFSVIFILLFIALLIPNHCPSPQYSYEATAIASLKAIVNAQGLFKKHDYYKKGAKVYANPKDGNGISDLNKIGYDGGKLTWDAHGFLDPTIAKADDSLPSPTPKAGYLFHDLKCADYTKQYAVFAYPAKYNHTGRGIFILDVTGTIWQIDANVLYPDIKNGDKVTPIDTYPTDKELNKWIPAVR